MTYKLSTTIYLNNEKVLIKFGMEKIGDISMISREKYVQTLKRFLK
jgi:hypothetical protein